MAVTPPPGGPGAGAAPSRLPWRATVFVLAVVAVGELELLSG